MDCLRLNRPCIFDGLGLNSTAVNKWGFGMKYDILDGIARLMGGDPSKSKKTQNVEPYKYLLEKIGDKEVRVFHDNDPQVGFTNPAFNSFKESTAV